MTTYRDSVIAAGCEHPDHVCDVERLVPCEGDVAMCVHCGRWWTGEATPLDYAVCYRITDAEAAARARTPMDPYDCLAALERAANSLEIEE